MTGRILIVDDERNIRIMIGKALEGFGLEIETAVNGNEALDMIKTKKFDLVLLDLRMPGVDGIEVLRQIRATSKQTKTAIITAHGTVDNAVEAMKLGAVDFVRKPFTVEELRRIVRDALERRGDFFRRWRDKLPEVGPSTENEDGTRYDYSICVQQVKAALEQGLISEAVPWAEKAVALAPLKAEGFNLLGSILEIQGDRIKSQNCFRAAIALDPTCENAWKNLDRSVGRSSGEDRK